ncbi:MAG: selenium-dependent molybdenum cofactor biosynthesis protein YqeB [Oscillospiraceae bacterium]|nr:selenium-dependent molybdenum cofactor biosynthesis protein YqeB [Oscillospiraceae bacterium]
MRVLIKGAGDIATGIALRLWHAGFAVVMTEIPVPTTIRRTVSFSPAVTMGWAEVEGIRARRAASIDAVAEMLAAGQIAVLIDPQAESVPILKPDAVVDAILAKRNLGTAISDAPLVIGVGPGFTAGLDCHAVIESNRGHDLGRVITQGSAAPNTGIPAEIGGHDEKRILRAPITGVFTETTEIGTGVRAGDVVGKIDDTPLIAEIDGILRGILATGVPVKPGMKCGDIDPRGQVEHCYTVSDKARSIGGGVLEAILRSYP